jgi:hypothetical protein
MTTKQRVTLLALNLRQMQMTDEPTLHEVGVFTSEVAVPARLSNRSAAVVLSQMRDFGWVQSRHGSESVGWLLTAKGVAALERDNAR